MNKWEVLNNDLNNLNTMLLRGEITNIQWGDERAKVLDLFHELAIQGYNDEN